MFDGRTHLNDLYERKRGRTTEYCTNVEVPGPKLGRGMPVYVLTSAMTFSGAEEFEARDERALSRGMNGLGVRVARGLNRVMRRRGKVLEDRYHGHILKTPTEVRRARNYLLQNARQHYGRTAADPYASRVAVVEAETFLLRRIC